MGGLKENPLIPLVQLTDLFPLFELNLVSTYLSTLGARSEALLSKNILGTFPDTFKLRPLLSERKMRYLLIKVFQIDWSSTGMGIATSF